MMTTHHVTVRDTRLAVHTSGSGIPVLLLHAFPLDHRMWQRQVPLAERLRLIVPDQRGFGQSTDGEPQSICQLAHDAMALLDAFHVTGPAVVCGVSMGGYVAQHIAVRYPERVGALVLVDTKLEADTDEARAGRAELAAKVGRLGPAILAEAMIPKLVAASVEAQALPGRAATVDLLHGMITSQRVPTIQAALSALGSRPDMTDSMRRVTAPTLLVVGAEDAITPRSCMETAEAVMPEAKLLEVPLAGHLVPLERPEIFNSALVAFLQSVPPERLVAAVPAP
jgi:pimeloyl-ACP methyl ester carboxylesterase